MKAKKDFVKEDQDPFSIERKTGKIGRGVKAFGTIKFYLLELITN